MRTLCFVTRTPCDLWCVIETDFIDSSLIHGDERALHGSKQQLLLLQKYLTLIRCNIDVNAFCIEEKNRKAKEKNKGKESVECIILRILYAIYPCFYSLSFGFVIISYLKQQKCLEQQMGTDDG